MGSRDLGLIKENTVIVRTGEIEASVAYPVFRQALTGNREVLGITASAMGLGEGQGYMGGGYDFNGERTTVIEYPVDGNFIPVMGMHLVAGRKFNRSTTSETANSVILTDTALRVTR